MSKRIAIIGGGVAARSLLYALGKSGTDAEITLFSSEDFASSCSLRSTAIVAPRGVSTGHSKLGDSLFEGYARFSRHIEEDHPAGVLRIPQFTGALTKLEAFSKRYPMGKKTSDLGVLRLQTKTYIAEEEAFLIRPSPYLDWLLTEARKILSVTLVSSYVTEVNGNELKTQEGRALSFDQIIFTAGTQNSFWSPLFPAFRETKSAQGCYLEFNGVASGKSSFSLTLEGDNLIYDAEKMRLLIGSTTRESSLELPPEKDLQAIYLRLKERTDFCLPEYSQGIIRTGLREKASKREPYIEMKDSLAMIGGFYKNGYSLSLSMVEKFLSSSAGRE